MAEEKNLILAIILSFLFGVGNIINGLTVRGIVECASYIIISILGATVSSIFSFIGLIYWAYILYDTYVCNKAVNYGEEIPKFLTVIELE